MDRCLRKIFHGDEILMHRSGFEALGAETRGSAEGHIDLHCGDSRDMSHAWREPPVKNPLNRLTIDFSRFVSAIDTLNLSTSNRGIAYLD